MFRFANSRTGERSVARAFLFTALCLGLPLATLADTPLTLPIADHGKGADIFVAPGESEAVLAATRDLQRDVAAVTGRRPKLLSAARPGCLLIGTAANAAAQPAFAAVGFPLNQLSGQWENFALRLTATTNLAIAGSDDRGTIFGIYDFATRYLGVDPVANWTGLPPARNERLVLTNVNVASGTPAFHFRGWFLNDEDLITGWHLSPERRRLVHFYFHLPIADDVYEKVFETALRLKCNVIIPGSYIDLESAVDRKIVAAAHRRGLFVSQHHTQPLGVSAFAFRNYWQDRGRKLDFSYTAHPAEMEAVWRHYAKLWAAYPNLIWQLGLRGTSDRPFWTADANAPKTDAERGAMISKAIQKQWDIVREVTGNAAPYGTATLWAEGSKLHQKRALNFPPGVTTVFADEGATQEMQQDFRDIPRQPGRNYGVYYHAAFWGAGPRLAQGVTIDKIARNYAAITAQGDTYFSILNVGSIREFLLQLEAVSAITWDGKNFDAKQYLRQWCAQKFGAPIAEHAAAQYENYFASFQPGKKSEALLLDGVLRFAGKDVLAAVLDRDSYPATVSSDVLDRLPKHAERGAKTAAAFQQVIADARKLAAEIPAPRRQFLVDNLIVQAQTMAGLGQWLSELCLGVEAYGNLEVKRAAEHARRSADALGRLLEERKQAEWGPWAHWYRGDWRMNLPALHEDTRRLAERWQEYSAAEQAK